MTMQDTNDTTNGEKQKTGASMSAPTDFSRLKAAGEELNRIWPDVSTGPIRFVGVSKDDLIANIDNFLVELLGSEEVSLGDDPLATLSDDTLWTLKDFEFIPVTYTRSASEEDGAPEEPPWQTADEPTESSEEKTVQPRDVVKDKAGIYAKNMVDSEINRVLNALERLGEDPESPRPAKIDLKLTLTITDEQSRMIIEGKTSFERKVRTTDEFDPAFAEPNQPELDLGYDESTDESTDGVPENETDTGEGESE